MAKELWFSEMRVELIFGGDYGSLDYSKCIDL